MVRLTVEFRARVLYEGLENLRLLIGETWPMIDGRTTRARYCWCDCPCFSFLRSARAASAGLVTSTQLKRS
jgi:hypothetical protein